MALPPLDLQDLVYYISKDRLEGILEMSFSGLRFEGTPTMWEFLLEERGTSVAPLSQAPVGYPSPTLMALWLEAAKDRILSIDMIEVLIKTDRATARAISQLPSNFMAEALKDATEETALRACICGVMAGKDATVFYKTLGNPYKERSWPKVAATPEIWTAVSKASREFTDFRGLAPFPIPSGLTLWEYLIEET